MEGMVMARDPKEAAEQAAEALAKANRVRFHLRDVQAGLRDGTVSLREALNDPVLQNVRLGRVLTGLRRYGRHKVERLMKRARVGSSFLNLPISRLTERQRDELARAVDDAESRRQRNRR